MDNKCEVCGRDITTMEEPCEQCGLDYDPLQPDFNQELDFDRDRSDRYERVPDVLDELNHEE